MLMGMHNLPVDVTKGILVLSKGGGLRANPWKYLLQVHA
jgi:hypothetical protein